MMDGDEFYEEVQQVVDEIQEEIKELVHRKLLGSTPGFQAAVKEHLNERVRFR